MPSTFHGFPNLLSIKLVSVVFESCTYEELLIRCPLLEILELLSDTTIDIKVSEIATLENIRELHLPLRVLGNTAIVTSFDVLQHLSLFSKLQELCLDFQKCKVLVKYKESFQTLLPCVKALVLNNLDFSCANMVSLAYALIFASRNARTLRISLNEGEVEDDADDADDMDDADDANDMDDADDADDMDDADDIDDDDGDDDAVDAFDIADIDCRKMGQLHLREVSIYYVTGLENEILLLKYLLSSSPWLKEMEVSSLSSKVPSRLVTLSKKLLKLHRASPIAEVDLFWI
ncbi:uncharacterized protein [Rutidosis leptorrhynchoides]|uniref:uncharacterized protein isoform X2 n=1 Tax=Rutidosis leptorrhynchoides TaxID=125765 RepID=UPI003A9931F8